MNAKAGNGTTPLHDAATKKITELLIAKGADVNAKDDDGRIPLLYAAEGGYNEIVKLLIDKGADVNVKDKRGLTPLHWVSISGHKEAAELLIDNGADVNGKDMSNWIWTPLDIATLSDNPNKTEIADLLRKHGGKTKKELEAAESIHAASRYGNIEAVKQHLAAGMDVDTRDAEYKTPLQHAAFGGYKEITELLIDASADVNTKDESLMTPLLWAAKKGHKEIAELLIAKGADVNTKVEGGVFSGRTPLDLAWLTRQTETIDLLRKHRAKTGKELEAEGK